MRLALCLAVLSSTALAQIAPCGTATCVGDSPGDVKLGGTITETRGPRPDGGLAILQPIVPGASLVLQSIQPTGTSAAPDVIIRASNKHDGGTILSVRNGNAEVFAVGASGATSSSSTISLLTVTSDAGIGGNLGVAGAVTTGTSYGFSAAGACPAAGTGWYQASATIMVGCTNGAAAWDIENVGGVPSIVPSNAGATIGLAGANGPIGLFSSVTVNGKASITGNGGSCTLNGGTPSTCTVTVTAGAKCQCSPVGGTAVIAAGGCAVNTPVGTTLTVTSFATASNDVNVLCDK